jgi:hypothetical protein
MLHLIEIKHRLLRGWLLLPANPHDQFHLYPYLYLSQPWQAPR